MPKELSQITFDFSSENKPEPGPIKEITPVEPSVPDLPKKARGRKKLTENEAEAAGVEVPDDSILFQKQYYSIGEVASMFKVNNSLLRYWEKEFDILEPRKNRKGDRFFRPIDIKNLQIIHDLLRRRKFTIPGAKDYLKKARQVTQKQEMIQSLQKLRSFLLELKASL
ncbi:MAG: MerR family transcriptional regulator [Candidatus Dadabacteria bacterium]